MIFPNSSYSEITQLDLPGKVNFPSSQEIDRKKSDRRREVALYHENLNIQTSALIGIKPDNFNSNNKQKFI